jgi:hypothetical protein
MTKKALNERDALRVALKAIGFVEFQEDGIFLIDQPTRSGEFCAIGVDYMNAVTFEDVIRFLGQMAFRYGRKDVDAAMAHQDIAQALMAHRATYFEGLPADRKTANG